MSPKKKITINEIEVTVVEKSNLDYISLTDMARFRDPNRTNYIVQNWLRTRYALEFCGLWEKLHNPVFKGIEFDAFKNEAGSNAFVMTPKKWIKSTNAIGIQSKTGRYGGGVFAHKDIESVLCKIICFRVISVFKRLLPTSVNHSLFICPK